MISQVRDYGWHCCGVFADEEMPGWTYSIGMGHTLGTAEICVFGLELSTAGRALNAAGDLMRAGHAIVPDATHRDILTGHEVTFRRVDPSWYEDLLVQALGFYRGQLPLYLQLVWPDQAGRYPWDGDVEPRCRDRQPMLWLPPDKHPRSIWTQLRDAEDWLFGDACPTDAVLTTRRILHDRAEVMGVIHDHDGEWQFLDGRGVDPADGAVTRLEDILELQPHLVLLADLPVGEQAWLSDGVWRRSALVDRGNHQ